MRAPDGMRWPIHFADLRRPPIIFFYFYFFFLIFFFLLFFFFFFFYFFFFLNRWANTAAPGAALRERGLALVDEQLIFETIEAQRALVEEAAVRTKAARQLVERRAKRALSASAPNVAAPTDPAQTEERPGDRLEQGPRL